METVVTTENQGKSGFALDDRDGDMDCRVAECEE
jgi:hypothetical protein